MSADTKLFGPQKVFWTEQVGFLYLFLGRIPHPGMNEYGKSSNTVTAAMIGAIATVLAAIIPGVIIINQRSDSSPVSISAGDAEDPTEAPSSPNAEATEQDDLNLDLLADACYDGDWLSCDDLFNLSPSGSDYEYYGGTCGGILDEISDETCDHYGYLADLASECEFGDLLACDDLYYESPIDSTFEYYGATCGERFDYLANGTCWELS